MAWTTITSTRTITTTGPAAATNTTMITTTPMSTRSPRIPPRASLLRPDAIHTGSWPTVTGTRWGHSRRVVSRTTTTTTTMSTGTATNTDTNTAGPPGDTAC